MKGLLAVGLIPASNWICKFAATTLMVQRPLMLAVFQAFVQMAGGALDPS